MAKLQSYFREFNDNIKLGEYEDNATLREKRDILRVKLEEGLPGVFEAHGEDCPRFHFRDQGSYKLRTGIKPTDGDFDIDQGLYFEVSTTDWGPVELKERVFEALDAHTKRVELRRSCVTVYYQKGGESEYHVDFAVYSDWQHETKLAKGKANSDASHRIWEEAAPELLEETLLDGYETEDRAQFRRCVRYLKQWKNKNFAVAGNEAPLGIGLTTATYERYRPRFSDVVSRDRDDSAALLDVLDRMISDFGITVTAAGTLERRLVVNLPVVPGNDLFERMTAKQMENFESKLKTLGSALEAAIDDADPVTACKKLAEVFGDGFPVPAKEATAAKVARAVVGNTQSALT